jgi:protein ImuB
MMTAVRTLVLHVDDWPVVAAGAVPDEPAAVFFANRVVAATPAARADDVEVGMRRRESQGRCPDLAILDHDPGRDARSFEPVVAALAERIAPRIEVVTPGHLAFATRGPSRYFGGDAALAQLAVELAGGVLGPRAEPGVGIADGPFAALLAARASSGGCRVVAPLGSPGFLAPQPVDALALAGVDHELLDVFRRLGLRTLGAVAALDPGDVAGRFGTTGTAAHRLASGRDERPPATAAPPVDLAARAELDPPAERVETAAFVARGLADELARRLDADGLACTRLLIAAETEHGERHERLWRGDGAGGAAALTAGAIADRVRWQLEGWIGTGGTSSTPTAGICLLELVADEVVPATGRQLGFWGGTAGADERAVRAVARVAGLLGLEAVTVPEWRGGRSPAEQVVLVPAAAVDLVADRPSARAPAARTPSVRTTAVRTTAGGHEGPPPWPGALPPPAPATLSGPVVAELVAADDDPVQVGGRGTLSAPPVRMRVAGGGWVDVVAWAGPWPMEERWWDAGRVRRRARLQILDDTGVARLLAQEGGRWWLEAVYD